MTHLSQVGPIPEKFKKWNNPTGYKNVFQLGIDPPTLFGTEHLFGDWNGELLIIAKDFAASHEVEKLIPHYPPEMVYRHSDGDQRYDKVGYQTNINLIKSLGFSNNYITGIRAKNCGIMYVNACFFLKIGSNRGKLPNFYPGNDVFDKSADVLGYVVETMRNLKAVMCLGSPALQIWNQTNLSFACSRNGIRSYTAPHPVARVTAAERMAAWRYAKEQSGLKTLERVP